MPTDVSPPYRIRTATAQDATQIAMHRAMMFRDMGLLPEAETLLLRDAAEDWLRRIILDGSYIGWMVHDGDDVVGGGGIHIRTYGPVPGCFEVGLAAHVANVYVEPSHRRRGLAEALVTKMFEWARLHNVKEFTLTASEEGRSLYRRLGFLPSPEFHTMKI